MAMRSSFLPAAALCAALVAIPALVTAAPPAQKAAPAKKAAATDWTKVVTDTGTGWRMGNPKAPNALVEYGSFNCGHCAEFAKAAMPVIRKQVAAGKLSFEFRPKQIFPHDPSATVLAHCVGKGRVFAYTDEYMEQSPAVLDRLRKAYAASPDVIEKAQAGGLPAMVSTLARLGDIAPIAARHGVTPAKAGQCLADKAILARVDANEKAALAAGVRGTPTFFLNGKAAQPAALEALGIPAGHRH